MWGTIHAYMEMSQQNSLGITKTIEWNNMKVKNNGGGELVQSILYTMYEVSQWNPIILLIYAN
jgi:hypothetical protein